MAASGISPRESEEYTWQPAGSRMTVQVRAPVFAQMKAAITSPEADAIGRRGVLLGRRTTLSSNPVLVVDSIDPIECCPGPFLSDAEHGKLAIQLSKLRNDRQTAVGFYRTVRDDATGELSSDDRKILDVHLPGTSSVFLHL